MPFHLPSSKSALLPLLQLCNSGQKVGKDWVQTHTPVSPYHNQFLLYLASGNSWWLTNRIALPSPPALAKACAVQHVPLIMTLVEGLVHIIGDTVHNALVCLRKSRVGLSATALSIKTKSFCLAHRSLQLTETDHDKLHSRKREPSCYLWSKISVVYTSLLPRSFISRVQTTLAEKMSAGCSPKHYTLLKLQNCPVVPFNRFHVWKKI